jgi:hypothetical protein
MESLKSCKTFLTFIKCSEEHLRSLSIASDKKLSRHVALYESFQICSTAPYGGVNYIRQVRD